MAQLLQNPFQQFIHPDTRLPLAGGKLYSYESGTLTPLATYKDAGEQVPNSNPVILDAAGMAEIWIKDESYDFVLTDADDNEIQSWSSVVILEDGAIDTDKIKNGAVTTAKIADDAVTSDKIAPLEVKGSNIASGAVSIEKLKDAVAFGYNPAGKILPQFPWENPVSTSIVLAASGADRYRFSPDGRFLAAAWNDSPNLRIFEIYDLLIEAPSITPPVFLVQCDDPDTPPPTGSVGRPGWSPDGRFLVVPHATSPYISIYRRDGIEFTKLADPPNLPAGTAWDVAWSPSGGSFLVAHEGSPYVSRYLRAGFGFTKTAGFTESPAGNGRAVDISPDLDFVVVGHDNSPYITIYWQGLKLSNPASLPAGNASSVAFSPDGKYLAVSHSSSPYITVYVRSSTTFTKIDDPEDLPTDAVSVAWSPDGKYLAVGCSNSPYLVIYEVSGSTISKVADPNSLPDASLPDAAIGNVDWSPSGRFLIASKDTAFFRSTALRKRSIGYFRGVSNG